jgi:hypothetical protein
MIHTFEVSINGKPFTKARMKSGEGVMTAILDWVKRKGEKKGATHFSVSGLDSAIDRHVYWKKPVTLETGDEVTIRITGNKKTNNPRKRRSAGKKFLLGQKIRYYHRLKKELEGRI